VLAVKSEAIVVHFSEIALKGKNRGEFEAALVRNISRILGDEVEGITKSESRIIIRAKEITPSVIGKLGKVFGISWFSPAYFVAKDMDEIKARVIDICGGLKGKTVKVEATRSDKSFPLTSPEINREVGKELELNGHKIDMENPERKIVIEILRNEAIISTERTNGIGGLPVGTAGRVLVLLSGGIDSPVAAWLMMKRGCSIDFLHVHSGPTSESVIESKIPKMVKKLMEYHPEKCRLFVAPYAEFYKKSMELDSRIELVLFRRFIFRLADRIAKANNHLGIVSGDNIGQVASQTLENLLAINDVTEIPIYRPLATFDKQGIVDLSKRIGTYELSIQEYKDCCSLVATKHPSTKVKQEKAREAGEKMGMENIIEKTMVQIEVVEF